MVHAIQRQCSRSKARKAAKWSMVVPMLDLAMDTFRPLAGHICLRGLRCGDEDSKHPSVQWPSVSWQTAVVSTGTERLSNRNGKHILLLGMSTTHNAEGKTAAR